MPEERDVLIDMNEQTEEHWRQYMAEFREKVYPIFSHHGFSFSEAYLAWRMEKLIDLLFEALNGSDDETP